MRPQEKRHNVSATEGKGKQIMVSYKDAGVDKEAGYEHVRRLKKMVASTQNEQVLGSLGSFAALYELGNYRNPVLVSGTDGVGTKT